MFFHDSHSLPYFFIVFMRRRWMLFFHQLSFLVSQSFPYFSCVHASSNAIFPPIVFSRFTIITVFFYSSSVGHYYIFTKHLSFHIHYFIFLAFMRGWDFFFTKCLFSLHNHYLMVLQFYSSSVGQYYIFTKHLLSLHIQYHIF